MYNRFSSINSWKFETISVSEIGIGGYKEAMALISGSNVFERLKFESGVHRVQRVPETESSGEFTQALQQLQFYRKWKMLTLILMKKI